MPQARIVKAFNTMYDERLAGAAQPPGAEQLVRFVAGDDPQAKRIVGDLIREIGFAPVDTGSLREGGGFAARGRRVAAVRKPDL